MEDSMAFNIDTIINNALMQLPDTYEINITHFCPYEYEFHIEDLNDLCRRLHSFLNQSFKEMNERAKKDGRHYLAANSRNLLTTIDIIENLIDGLNNLNITLKLNEKYQNQIVFCKSFLKISNGSTIPETYTDFHIDCYTPIFELTSSVFTSAKNVIFGSKTKPDIYITDGIDNSIEIANKTDGILIYDEPINKGTVTIHDIKTWWQKDHPTNEKFIGYLCEQLNEIEAKFCKAYYQYFSKETDPALFSQVHLHYDPKTITQLVEIEGKKKRLTFQRMDFLILYNNYRIIIEIDGVEHYSSDGKPDSKKYSDQVAYDRKMKFLGYHIFRLGGYELSKNFDTVVNDFFKSLRDNYFS